MYKVGKFEKVSKEQFVKDFKDAFDSWSEEEIVEIYNDIKLPQRATKGSAGYDFYAPMDFKLAPREQIKMPTGIRVKIEDGWFLGIFPRSGWGFKFRMQLNNTVGIIDSDYYYSSNEGHIISKMTNDSVEGKVLEIKKGAGMTQAIFLPFGITEDDACEEVRDGGFGSTTK